MGNTRTDCQFSKKQQEITEKILAEIAAKMLKIHV